MRSVARAAGTGKAAIVIVAVGELVPAVGGPVHHHVADVALVNILAGGLGQCSVAEQAGLAVCIFSATNLSTTM